MDSEKKARELYQTASQLDVLAKKLWNFALALERERIRNEHNMNKKQQ